MHRSRGHGKWMGASVVVGFTPMLNWGDAIIGFIGNTFGLGNGGVGLG